MPDKTSKGDIDIVTNVNFHPLKKPIIKPVRQLDRCCRQEPNLSPMPSLTL